MTDAHILTAEEWQDEMDACVAWDSDSEHEDALRRHDRALRAEVARLREALERADECFTGYTLTPRDVTDRVERLRLTVRGALADHEPLDRCCPTCGSEDPRIIQVKSGWLGGHPCPDQWHTAIATLAASHEACRAEVARLREALARYGEHALGCFVLSLDYRGEDDACTCGLEAMLRI